MEAIRHFPLPYRGRGRTKQQDPGGGLIQEALCAMHLFLSGVPGRPGTSSPLLTSGVHVPE